MINANAFQNQNNIEKLNLKYNTHINNMNNNLNILNEYSIIFRVDKLFKDKNIQ